MNTNHTSASVLFTIAIMVLVSLNSASAQSAEDQTVIAFSRDGTAFKAPARLRVTVHALTNSYLKFQVCLENNGGGYVTIRLKDGNGKNVHRPIFLYRKTLVANFDMRRAKEGTYIVEVATRSERYQYPVQISSKVVRSVEIKQNTLAKLKQ
jgi:hypothetical protein